MGEKMRPLPTWRVSAIRKKAEYIMSVFAPATEAAVKLSSRTMGSWTRIGSGG